MEKDYTMHGLEHNIAYTSGKEIEKLSANPYTKQETAARQNSYTL